MKRGDIHWVELGTDKDNKGSEIYKCRPCVILSSTAINMDRRTVVIIPFSSSAPVAPPIAIETTSLKDEGVIVVDQIRAVDKSKIKQKICKISDKDMKSLEEALRIILVL